MRVEPRVCRHCFDGEHDNEHTQSVSRDLVACARTVWEHQDELEPEDVYIRTVSEEIAPELSPEVWRFWPATPELDPVPARTRDRREVSQVRPVRPMASDDGQ